MNIPNKLQTFLTRPYPNFPKDILYRFVIETIITRTPAPLPDSLLVWAGHYLMTGDDFMSAMSNVDGPPDTSAHIEAISGMAITTVDKKASIRSRDEYFGFPLPLTPQSALLMISCYLTNVGVHHYGRASACLMSVFDTEEEALTYCQKEFKP